MSIEVDRPSRFIESRDGTRIAVFSSGDGPPVVLVHGASADHTTWRNTGPVLARTFRIHAIDRRGRGASGDGQGEYAIEREFEDVAAVADALAAESGRPVAVVGHSYGGRCGLGAALVTEGIGLVVTYEGAPSPAGAAAERAYRPSGVEDRIARLIDAGDRDGALATFMREIVRMPEAELAAYKADPVWPARAAAVHTTLRELAGEASPAASLDALSSVRQPVLQILGGDSAQAFHVATEALNARLGDGRVVTIAGARHAAHHTHVAEFTAAIRAFLDEASVAD